MMDWVSDWVSEAQMVSELAQVSGVQMVPMLVKSLV